MLPLVAGFGIQVGLYWHIRLGLQQRAGGAASVACTGGVSTGAMVGCCLHHGTDLLPVLGLPALATFLTRYQPAFLVVGILSNLYGISLMLGTIKEMGLYRPGQGVLAQLVRPDLRRLRLSILALSPVVLLLVLLTAACSGGAPAPPATPSAPRGVITLAAQEDSQGGLTAVVEGKLRPGELLELQVALDTHSGSLDFDLAQVAALEDSLGNRYPPLGWQGSSPGGHHRSGVLRFSSLQGQPDWLRLTLRDLSGIPQRSFTWRIR